MPENGHSSVNKGLTYLLRRIAYSGIHQLDWPEGINTIIILIKCAVGMQLFVQILQNAFQDGNQFGDFVQVASHSVDL